MLFWAPSDFQGKFRLRATGAEDLDAFSQKVERSLSVRAQGISCKTVAKEELECVLPAMKRREVKPRLADLHQTVTENFGQIPREAFLQRTTRAELQLFQVQGEITAALEKISSATPKPTEDAILSRRREDLSELRSELDERRKQLALIEDGLGTSRPTEERTQFLLKREEVRGVVKSLEDRVAELSRSLLVLEAPYGDFHKAESDLALAQGRSALLSARLNFLKSYLERTEGALRFTDPEAPSLRVIEGSDKLSAIRSSGTFAWGAVLGFLLFVMVRLIPVTRARLYFQSAEEITEQTGLALLR